jgi:flagellar biosynthetic protein FliR
MSEPEISAAAVGLGAARTLPIAWLVPAFGGPNVPAPIRSGWAWVWRCCACHGWRAGADAGPALWLLLLVREAAVGLTLGFVASLIFRAAEGAGRLTDCFAAPTWPR